MVHTVGDVFPDRSGEQDRLLGNDGDMGTVTLKIQCVQIQTVNQDTAFRGFDKANDQIQDRGLTGTGAAYEGYRFTGFNMEADVLKDR